MSESIDVYSDQFQLNFGPYGSALNFMLSSAQPPAPGSAPQAEKVATIRMSLEHLKVMTFILNRQVKLYEGQARLSIGVPIEVLNSLTISLEDWESFWKRA
jgi:hypothetical protein